jgi:hypothetical protein
MVNKRTSINKEHILLLVRYAIMGNSILCSMYQIHFSFDLLRKAGFADFFWYADLLFQLSEVQIIAPSLE